MFDAAKGILMMVVVLVHTSDFLYLIAPDTQGNGGLHIYSLVPISMFFMISGYSFHQEKNLGAYIKQQAKYLLLPYALTPLIAIPIRTLLYTAMGRFSPDRITRILWGFLYGATQPIELLGQAVDCVDAMWFLPALFWGGLLHQLFRRIKNPRLAAGCIWGVVLAAMAMPSASTVQVPWLLVQACTSLGYLELGRLAKKYKVLYRRLSPAECIAALVLWGILQRYSGGSLWANVWTFGPLDYLGSGWIVTVLLRVYLQSGFAVARIAEPAAYIGRYSLYFLFVHGLELVVLPWSVAMGGVTAWFGLPYWMNLTALWLARVVVATAGCEVIRHLQRRLYQRKSLRKE